MELDFIFGRKHWKSSLYLLVQVVFWPQCAREASMNRGSWKWEYWTNHRCKWISHILTYASLNICLPCTHQCPRTGQAPCQGAWCTPTLPGTPSSSDARHVDNWEMRDCQPTSHPHSPSAHGLWSAQRLLQHLKPLDWIAFHQLITTSHSFRPLYISQVPMTCVALTFWVVWISLNWKPWPACMYIISYVIIKSIVTHWLEVSAVMVSFWRHLLIHSTSQSIPPLLPGSFPGALHWLWSVLLHGPSNGKKSL